MTISRREVICLSIFQGFEAFNDNAIRFAFVLLGLHYGSLYLVLPLILFSGPHLVFTRFSHLAFSNTKRSLILIKALEFVWVVIGIYGLLNDDIWALAIATFLTGVLVSFMAPLRLAYVSKVGSEEQNLGVTATIESATVIMIALGTVFGTFCIEAGYLYLLCLVMIAFMVVGSLALIPLPSYDLNAIRDPNTSDSETPGGIRLKDAPAELSQSYWYAVLIPAGGMLVLRLLSAQLPPMMKEYVAVPMIATIVASGVSFFILLAGVTATRVQETSRKLICWAMVSMVAATLAGYCLIASFSNLALICFILSLSVAVYLLDLCYLRGISNLQIFCQRRRLIDGLPRFFRLYHGSLIAFSIGVMFFIEAFSLYPMLLALCVLILAYGLFYLKYLRSLSARVFIK